MKNVKIGSKLILSFLFVAVLTAFIGLYLMNSMRTVDLSTNVLYDQGAVPLGMLVKTAEYIQDMRLNLWKWQRAETDESRAEIIKAMKKSQGLVKELISKQRELVLVEAGKIILDNLQSATDKFMAEAENYMKTAKIHPITGSPEKLYPVVPKAADEMLEALDAAIERRTGSTKKLSDDASEVARHSENLAMVFLIIVLLISMGFGILLTSSITHPLNKVVNTLKSMEKGDMTVRASLEREDELGILSKALDSLSSRLQSILRNLRQNSDTLAGSAEELSSVSGQLTNGAELASSKTAVVSGSIDKMSGNINAMANGAEEASVNASEVAGAAEQMSTNMNTIATAVEEMSASISQIAGNANDASKVANEATVKSNEATDAMGKLGVAAKEIGQVTEVIKRIADKTNLLALNATIEAASAGEAGKGFAVVAGEIKELANQSSQSADDIARRIEGIQEGTSAAVDVINSVSDIINKMSQRVEAITSLVGQQTKASNEIASNVAQANVGTKRVAQSVSEVAKGSKDIARNAGEAAKGAVKVSQNVTDVNQVTKESVQGATQINQSATELAKLANDLKGVLSQFRV